MSGLVDITNDPSPPAKKLKNDEATAVPCGTEIALRQENESLKKKLVQLMAKQLAVPSTTSTANSVSVPALGPSSTTATATIPVTCTSSAAKKNKKEKEHVLLWICAAGKGQGRAWKQKALRVIGVNSSKQAAEKKKEEVMSRHDCCGHGDICVGGTWEDEIDLVVRPVEEVQL
mmetsp:Transcript_2637/g.4088  ORF Transcript_2637/g.4088 Transcript_2637/m.4088 type:complete len:174 (+) Transcript_2637:47-568(+)|eukprot:CAMPEP_0174972194 /NCGR_PEP_ID=MMETSP0004_2-20121128/10487_1 /TAXON_ID=420556 /ORGANISM="Ochromonas sp., Strain CCMP1393" /LENGTH=173 /DNA_ID=CAMNT_0016222377 /DNA_START=6 /DNA_END=527 /DNA_ORIENTATION=-